MAASKELYTILGVDETASESEIRSAYTLLAGSNPEGTPERARIDQAYAVLSDMDRRAQYDITGKTGCGIRRNTRAGQHERRERVRYRLNTIFLAGAAIAIICFLMQWGGVWSTTPFYWTCGISLGIKIVEYIIRLIP